MTPNFRFAIFAAVSSDPQAREDKASLPDQVENCRRTGLALGGIETTEPFILDGYSRSGYVNLSDALQDIPPLEKAVEAAMQNRYDVLIMDNIERMGDLAPMLSTLFKQYKKQLHSARQSGRIHDPRNYDPSADEAGDIMIHVEGIIQRYRQNKMRRAWQAGVPMRIEKGLHPLSLPFGYQLTSPGQPATLIPEKAALILQMKDMMLAGETYAEIARRADQSNVPPPRGKVWSRQAVKRILTNPFYGGIVRFGTFRNRIPAQRSEWKEGPGRHEPLWDETTYHALVSEHNRRMIGKRNYAAKYPFTGLPVCGICGSKIQKHGKRPFEYLACKTHRHWAMRYEKAVEFLTLELARQLQEYQSSPPEPIDLAPLRRQLEDIKARRARVQAGYESGIYEAGEAHGKLNALQEEAETTLRTIEKAQSQERTRQDWQARMGGLQGVAEGIPRAIQHDDPVRVNQMLTAFIDKIILKGSSAQFVWRE